MSKIEHLVELGVLRKVEGMSPFNSPVFLVAKAELGSWRMINCIVKLNRETVLLSQYPMMRVDDSYSLLPGMTRFSTLDFADGFYQIGIRPDHQGRTAFAVTGEGHWEYIRMAQGLLLQVCCLLMD